jgi:hypothetical protein
VPGREKSFRLSKHDLQARPVYHHQHDSIEAHLKIVFAALAVSRWIEDGTGWSIRKFVCAARRYKTHRSTLHDKPVSVHSPRLTEDRRLHPLSAPATGPGNRTARGGSTLKGIDGM